MSGSTLPFLPYMSLLVGAVFAALAWQRRAQFAGRPYLHWFVFLHMAAVGLHQFEEYGYPGGFRDAFVAVFGTPEAATLVPSLTELQLANVVGLTTFFFLIGLLGTRVVWVGLALLFCSAGNGFFHLVYSVTQMDYLPGAITGTLLYMPLALLATRYAVLRGDVDAKHLLLAFFIGTAASFAPFMHVWMLHVVH